MKNVIVFGVLLVLVSGCNLGDQAPPGSEADGAASDTSSDDASEHDTSTSDTSTTDTADTGSEDASDVVQDVVDAPDAASGIVFRITSPRSDRAVGYRLELAAEPTRVQNDDEFDAEESDSIVEDAGEWLITGETGTAPSSNVVHGDTFSWELVQSPQYGIIGWSADAPAADYTITINGNEIDPATLPALDPDPVDQTGCLGGGDCYGAHISATQADVVLGASTDLSALRAALANASSGDVIFIDAAAEIDLGFFSDGPSIEIPAGVTLAGDRGVDGSPGARLYGGKKSGSSWVGSDTIKVNDNVRITGLRIEGPDPNRDMNWLDADHDYTDGIEAKNTSGVEIDNNEIYGWPTAAVHGGDPIHVHHNFIHDNDQSGLGYGVSATKWGSVIEYNDFQRNRHAIAGAGDVGDGYTVRFNVFGSEGIGGAGHKIDMHEDGNSAGDAGTRIEIYRNTVEFANAQAVYLRATPRESSEIYDNWFYNATPPCLTKDRSGSYCSIEVKANDWTNVTYRDNHLGTTEPVCTIGGPRDGC